MASSKNNHREDGGILVAEDSPTQAEQLRHLLVQRYQNVTLAANGKEALLAARRHKPAIIISDVIMPEMDGYALCRAIKSDDALRDVPVVLVTTLSDPRDVIEGLACGADNFIRKPFRERYLLSRIDQILANRELRQSAKMQMGIEILVGGQRHFISSDRQQILDLLISTYEEAVRLNDDLKSHAAQVEAANRELESFSYSVSHDLRAPLRAIAGFSRMLEEDYSAKLDEEGRRLIRVVCDNAHKMGQLIDDLLAFSRVGRNPIAETSIDMEVLARNALHDIGEPGTSGRARIEIKPLPEASGDPTLIKQVWVNLLSNAIKFSGKRDEPRIEVSAYVEGSGTIYCVKDNGAGFDMRYYDKLFGVFQRLHSAEEFPGTGVGLAIVQRVVARHGGRVWAEGERDKGATFYFTLGGGE